MLRWRDVGEEIWRKVVLAYMEGVMSYIQRTLLMEYIAKDIVNMIMMKFLRFNKILIRLLKAEVFTFTLL